MEWVIPVTAFFLVSSLYLSHENVEYEGGGGFQQMAGFLTYTALFMVVFALVHGALQGLAGSFVSAVVSTLAAIVAMPILAHVAFRVVGVRVRKVGPLLRGREAAH